MKWKNSCRCPLSIINVYQENLGKKFCYEFCPLNEIKNTQCILEIFEKYRKSERPGVCLKYFLSFPQATLDLLEDAKTRDKNLQDTLDRLAMLHKHCRTNYKDMANLMFALNHCQNQPRCPRPWMEPNKLANHNPPPGKASGCQRTRMIDPTLLTA